MDEVTSHKLNDLNKGLDITGHNREEPGGACTQYKVDVNGKRIAILEFQRGPIPQAGINGLSNEALIAVVIDRLQGFNKGPYACRENSLAITKLEEAMHWLHHRTLDRMARGVEGSYQK